MFQSFLGFFIFMILRTEGKLPAIVEDRTDQWKDVFRVTPQPPVASNEILVRNGFPLDNDLQYIFDYKEPRWFDSSKQPLFISKSDFSKAQRYSNCKDLLSPGFITFKKYTAKYDGATAKWFYSTEGFVERGVTPYIATSSSEEDQPPLRLLRRNCDTASYSGCWRVTELKNVDFYLYDAKKLRTIIGGQCDLCIVAECITTCPQGTFATKAASYDSESGLQSTQFECRSCDPGTWNTCLRSNECSW
jgi:hypothetical protein